MHKKKDFREGKEEFHERCGRNGEGGFVVKGGVRYAGMDIEAN